MKIKTILITLSLFFLTQLLFSLEIKEANENYKNSNFEKAIELYKKEDFNKNPYLLYNIANCYYKIGNKTYAFYYYLKAFTIIPRNKNIKENMIKVSSELNQTLFSEDIPQIIYSIYYFLSEKEILTLFEFFFILFALFLILNSKSEDNRFASYILITLLFSIILGGWYILRQNSIFHNLAVTKNEVDIYSGPKKTFNILATLPEGRVIVVLSKNDDFIEIGIPKENIKGWIEKDKILIVNEEGD